MSGIKIVGLVLGAFPIIQNCLDNYRKGFEGLAEWWTFRSAFIAFVDDINHQMMRFHENMAWLLDPIVEDDDILNALLCNPGDPRWHDECLDVLVEQSLASECQRFFRIVESMNKVEDLKILLEFKDGNVILP